MNKRNLRVKILTTLREGDIKEALYLGLRHGNFIDRRYYKRLLRHYDNINEDIKNSILFREEGIKELNKVRLCIIDHSKYKKYFADHTRRRDRFFIVFILPLLDYSNLQAIFAGIVYALTATVTIIASTIIIEIPRYDAREIGIPVIFGDETGSGQNQLSSADNTKTSSDDSNEESSIDNNNEERKLETEDNTVNIEDPDSNVKVEEEEEKKKKEEERKRQEAMERKRKEEAARKAAEAKAAKEREEQALKDMLSNSSLSGNDKEDTGKPGNQGDPHGDPNSNILKGISTGSGRVGGGLGSRKVEKTHTPKDNSQTQGTVAVEVCIDRSGNVISAKRMMRGTTTTSTRLQNLAISSAKKWKFSAGQVDKQCGTITYNFKAQ